MELALEGERRCKKGDCRAGVIFLEEAITKRDVVDKADARTLSAIYRYTNTLYRPFTGRKRTLYAIYRQTAHLLTSCTPNCP